MRNHPRRLSLRRTLPSLSLAVLCFFFLFPAALSAEPVLLNGYEIDTGGIRDKASGRTVLKGNEGIPGRAWIVGATARDSGALKRRWRDRGGEVEGYVPEGGYLVRFGREESAGTVLSLPGAAFAVPLLPEMKIHRALSLPVDGEAVNLVCHLFRSASMDLVANRAISHGIAVVSRSSRDEGKRFGIRCPVEELGSVVNLIARWDDVYFIQRAPGVRLLNTTAVRILQSGDFTGPVSIWNRGVFGESQVIAVLDTGIDADSCYFRDPGGLLPPANIDGATAVDPSLRKVIAVDFLLDAEDPGNPLDWDTEGHGTSVAGSAAGSRVDAPTSESVGNGLAPLAQLVMQDGGYAVDDCADLPALGCPLVDFIPFLDQAYEQGARIHNNSWGDRENLFPHNTYSPACADVDAFTWEHKDFLCVFAAGNDGNSPGVVSSPSVAKNALSVGGTGNGSNADTIVAFSSRGPASDGRIKPDLVAPASVSTAQGDGDVTTANCGLRSTLGTSFSSPLTAGAAALVRDYLAQGFYPGGVPDPANAIEHPSAALVKAILIDSCVDVTSASDIPADDQGWGRVRLDRALLFSGDVSHLLLTDAPAGFSSELDPPLAIPLSVGDSAPLKVTLVWSDYPALPGADIHLVNDLDLRVEGPGGPYLGNAFAGGYSVTGGSPDRRNNVEQVWIGDPTPGQYEILIQPHLIVEGPQDFAVVVTGEIAVEGPTEAGLWRFY